MKTEGKRVFFEGDNIILAEGEYGKYNGTWYARPPGSNIGNLDSHEVTEHPDGTITVQPSILLEAYDHTWHGYLEHGVWREV